MFTIKQMEALYWVATLGRFEAASLYLNLSQSTISKRIAELEQRFTVPLFDRSGRQAILTGKGEEIRGIAEEMLRLNDRLSATARSSNAPPMRFRMGATDLVAMSWLPELLSRIMQRYPSIEIEPEIEITATLLERLAERRIDFAICPRIMQHPQFVNTALGRIELAWMCSPRLWTSDTAMSTADLLRLPLLTQSAGSILRPVLQSVIDNPKLPFAKKITCNNMGALAELAAFGLGITILPRAFFSRHIADQRLRVIETEIPLPMLEYYINYRNDYHSGFFQEVSGLCQEICDFTAHGPND